MKAAKDFGFSHIQIASTVDYCRTSDFARRAAKRHGLHTVYLQFDGLSDEVYVKTRGRGLLDTKLKAVEAMRKASKIVYVPTIAGGINEDQVGPILKFA